MFLKGAAGLVIGATACCVIVGLGIALTVAVFALPIATIGVAASTAFPIAAYVGGAIGGGGMAYLSHSLGDDEFDPWLGEFVQAQEEDWYLLIMILYYFFI